jgi:hypothetical protein
VASAPGDSVSGGLGTVARLRNRGGGGPLWVARPRRPAEGGGDVPEAFRAMWDRSGGSGPSALVAPPSTGAPLPESARRGHMAFGRSLATLEHLFASLSCVACASPPLGGPGGELPGSVAAWSPQRGDQATAPRFLCVVAKPGDKVPQAAPSPGAPSGAPATVAALREEGGVAAPAGGGPTEGAAGTTSCASPRVGTSQPQDVRQGFLDIAPFLLDPAGVAPPLGATTCPAPGARAPRAMRGAS